MARAEDAAAAAWPDDVDWRRLWGGVVDTHREAFVAGWEAALASIDREVVIDRARVTLGRTDERDEQAIDAVIEAIREDS